jgi:hypothetical protein
MGRRFTILCGEQKGLRLSDGEYIPPPCEIRLCENEVDQRTKLTSAHARILWLWQQFWDPSGFGPSPAAVAPAAMVSAAGAPADSFGGGPGDSAVSGTAIRGVPGREITQQLSADSIVLSFADRRCCWEQRSDL